MSAQSFSCLVVDDDAGFASMLAKVVREEGGQAVVCGGVEAARGEVERRAFDLAFLDNRLPDGSGYEFYSRLKQRCPACVVVMVTGAPELAQAVELTRNGLFDYLTKPVDVGDFTACLRRMLQRLSRPESGDETTPLVGNSPALAQVLHQIRQAARHPSTTVLLLGETGTGKDLAARLLHQITFAHQPSPPAYVALNCSTVPGEMFEAEVFGSEKGAYTGAEKRRGGLVEAAEGGTLFLDEVAEIPLLQQVKFLRFLESREYRSLGTTAPKHFTGRVVAATNRSLAEEARQGRFREDLLFRLEVFPILLPPLRERLSDLDALVEFLLGQLCAKYQRKKPLLKTQDLDALRSHNFPGNVRELRNLLERSLLKTAEDAAWLDMDLAWLSERARAAPEPAGGSSEARLSPERSLSPLDLQEYQLIQKALREESGGIRRAAVRLGLTHQALLRRLQKWPELRQVPPPLR